MARMIRTQIHLDEPLVEALDREAARSGASRAEVIRRALHERYPDGDDYAARKQAALDLAFGSWKGRRFKSGAEYVRALRDGKWDVIDG